MQVDHMAMIFAFTVLAGFLAIKGRWFVLACAALSQVPFWIGSVYFMHTGVTPVELNMVADLAVCAAFVWLAYRFRLMWLIWLGIVFLSMGIIDVYAAFAGMLYYFEMHVFLHFIALLVIAGRRYVDRVDRPLGDNLPSSSD